MPNLDELRAIVLAIGPESADIEAVGERAEGDWVLSYPDIDVALEFDRDTRRLMVSVEIDAPLPEARLDVFTTLLTYSLLWRDTGGVYVALTAEGAPVLMLPLFADEVTTDLLRAVVENLRDKARLLRTYVAHGGGDTLPSFDGLSMSAIRV